ncbi:MAG: glycosyltransferase family 4 protein [Actinomycetota bacterium]
MRILFLAKDYPPAAWHGVSVYLQKTTKALAERGHEVHVLDVTPKHRVRDQQDGDVVVHYRRTLRLRGSTRIRRRLPTRVVRFLDRRASAFRRERLLRRLNWAISYYREYRRLNIDFDVVEAYDVFFLGLLFSLLHPRPLVVCLHSPPLSLFKIEDGERKWRARLCELGDRINVRGADLLTSPSRLLVQARKNTGFLNSNEPWIVPNMVDPALWASVRSVRSTRPVVLAYGVESIKAPEVLAEAAAILRPQVPGIEVIIVGRSVGTRAGRPYGDWLAERVEELRAPVRLVGQIPHPQMPEFHGLARVLAIPSHFEVFSGLALEAMASGRPIVCTSRVGVSELADESEAITVVPMDDPTALAEALRPHLENVERAAEAGERARLIVKARLNPERIAREREVAYGEAVRRWRLRQGASR